jgi:hypothetical protein
MITVPIDYVIVTTVLAMLIPAQIVWRIMHPWRCGCGRRDWFASWHIRHVHQKHEHI